MSDRRCPLVTRFDRLRRDRAALVFLALAVAGGLLLAGVLAAILLPGGGKHATRPSSTTLAGDDPAAGDDCTLPGRRRLRRPLPPALSAWLRSGLSPRRSSGRRPARPRGSATGSADLGPTMWAPVVGRRATLTGLRFGTAYRVWAGDATLDLTTAPAPVSPVAATAAGAIVLDGQPFFPLLVLAQCPAGYESSLAAGMTLYAENPCGGIGDQTAALNGRALSLTTADEAGIGGPGVIGWYYPDEADLKGLTGATLPQFPTQAETGRLSVLTLSNHFYSRTAPLPGGRGVYPGLIAKSDVVGFDLYPLQEFCSAAWLPGVAAAQRELVAARRRAADVPVDRGVDVEVPAAGAAGHAGDRPRGELALGRRRRARDRLLPGRLAAGPDPGDRDGREGGDRDRGGAARSRLARLGDGRPSSPRPVPRTARCT